MPLRQAQTSGEGGAGKAELAGACAGAGGAAEQAAQVAVVHQLLVHHPQLLPRVHLQLCTPDVCTNESPI